MFCVFSHISAMIITFSYTILNMAVDFSSISKLTYISAFQVLQNIEFSSSKSHNASFFVPWFCIIMIFGLLLWQSSLALVQSTNPASWQKQCCWNVMSHSLSQGDSKGFNDCELKGYDTHLICEYSFCLLWDKHSHNYEIGVTSFKLVTSLAGYDCKWHYSILFY